MNNSYQLTSKHYTQYIVVIITNIDTSRERCLARINSQEEKYEFGRQVIGLH